MIASGIFILIVTHICTHYVWEQGIAFNIDGHASFEIGLVPFLLLLWLGYWLAKGVHWKRILLIGMTAFAMMVITSVHFVANPHEVPQAPTGDYLTDEPWPADRASYGISYALAIAGLVFAFWSWRKMQREKEGV